MRSLIKLVLVGGLVTVGLNASVLNIGGRKMYIHTKKVWDYDKDKIKFLIKDGKLVEYYKDIKLGKRTVKFGGDCKQSKKIATVAWRITSDTGCIPKYGSILFLKTRANGWRVQIGKGGHFNFIIGGADVPKECKNRVTNLKVEYKKYIPLENNRVIGECTYNFRIIPDW